MPQGIRSARGTKRVLVLVGATVLVAAAGAVLVLHDAGAGTIDGTAIGDRGLAYATTEVRRTVENAGGDEGALRQAAVQRLREDQALLDLAGREGLTEYGSVDEILEDIDAVNAERRDALEAGLPVYGPVQYSPEQLVGKTLTDLRTDLVDRLRDQDDEALAISDGDVAARLDADPSAWAADATTFSLSRVRLPAADADGVLTGASFDEASALPGAEIDRLELAPGSPEMAAWNPRLVEEIQASDVGALLGPVPDRGGWSLLRLDDAVFDRDAAFDAYAPAIRSVLEEEAFDRLLAATVAEQDVDLT